MATLENNQSRLSVDIGRERRNSEENYRNGSLTALTAVDATHTIGIQKRTVNDQVLTRQSAAGNGE